MEIYKTCETINYRLDGSHDNTLDEIFGWNYFIVITNEPPASSLDKSLYRKAFVVNNNSVVLVGQGAAQ